MSIQWVSKNRYWEGDDDLGLTGKFQCRIFKLLQSLTFPFLKSGGLFSQVLFIHFKETGWYYFLARECIYDASSMQLFVPKVEVN